MEMLFLVIYRQFRQINLIFSILNVNYILARQLTATLSMSKTIHVCLSILLVKRFTTQGRMIKSNHKFDFKLTNSLKDMSFIKINGSSLKYMLIYSYPWFINIYTYSQPYRFVNCILTRLMTRAIFKHYSVDN